MRYSVKFSNLTQVRMASPYHVAKIELKGDFIPELSQIEAQDLYCLANNGARIYLVEWRVRSNRPGFRILLIDSIRKTMSTSVDFAGFCHDLKFDESKGCLFVTSLQLKSIGEHFEKIELSDKEFNPLQL